MTDEQIINALKSCGDRIAICDDCPYEGRNHCSLLAKQDIIERFTELKAENAVLRERLEKAMELPCKVGDTIFYVQYFCDYKGCDSTTQQFCCGCKEMIEREKRKEKYVICEKSFVLEDLEKIGKKYFTTREAAESRLAELKGEER